MQVYIGIDWSEDKHDVVFQNPAGGEVLRRSVAHSASGFEELDDVRRQLGVEPRACVVGLETAHSLLIDFLWARQYSEIYVLPPNQVKSSQGRLRQSGARDDWHDAALIAELVRTDRHRFYPWYPGSPLLQQMRAKVSFLGFLTQNIVRFSNRLRSVLLRYYPAALLVFSNLKVEISQAFIQAYPTPQAAAQLSFKDFQSFARAQRYPNPGRLAACYARLQTPQPVAEASTVLAYQGEAQLLAGVLNQLVRAKRRALRELTALFEQHPDSSIFASLPGAGDFLSPALLVKFGEDRRRFPSPSSLQTLAGTCPVTVKSGKTRWVRFRQACDKSFRHITQQWARCSVKQSVWAAYYYQQARPRCRSESHAYRCLANRWLAIAWKIWQDHTTYDESYHLQRRAQRALPRRRSLLAD
jgi:transposase